MRIDVIANTTASRFRKTPNLLDALRGVCGGQAEVHATSNLGELKEICGEIHCRGTDLIVLAGGDGSHMAGLSALWRAFRQADLPRMALLPGGTVATVARNWGMRGNPVLRMGELLKHKGELRAIERATLRVEVNADDTSSPASPAEVGLGFTFGTGLVANFFSIYYASGAGGYATAARVAARTFVESFYGGAFAARVLAPTSCLVEVDGRALASHAWSLICASVVSDLGIGMRVNYRAGQDLSRIHLVASCLSPRALGPRAPFVLAGRSIGGPGHFDDLVPSFSVRFDHEGPYVLDGDMFQAHQVRVSAGPRIRVVALPRRPLWHSHESWARWFRRG